MHDQMVESSSIFQEEGTYPRLKKHLNSQLDNYTDAIMLLTAAYPEVDNAWEAAIDAERYTLSQDIIGSDSPADMLVYIYQEGSENAHSCGYARYWHGYLVFLKPLLMFLNYGEIRILIKCVQLGLFAIVLLKIFKKDWRLALPLLATGIYLNLSSTSLSLQFNSVLIITLIAMLLLLYFENKFPKQELYSWGLFFMIVGVFTAYFDLLTYPLVSLGLPLAVWIILNFSEKFMTNIKRIVYLSAFWGIGYGGMWSLKWVLGVIITKENIIGDAINKIVDRTSSVAFDNDIKFLDVIIRQLGSGIQKSWALIILAMCIVWILHIVTKKRVQWNLLLTLAVISLYPLIWYFGLKNHSYIHCWFTYRELAITNFAMISYIMLEVFGNQMSDGIIQKFYNFRKKRDRIKSQSLFGEHLR